jgi:hypothetical protein
MSNEQKNSVSKDLLEAELNVVLEEYKTLREELLANIDASRQILTLTLTGAGLFLAVSPIFVQSQLLSLFLVVPFLFYSMAWAQLRYVLLGHDISNYLREVIEPRIHRNLSELAPTAQRDFTPVLGWSDRGGGLLKHHKSIFILPIAGANYGIPLIAAVSSIVAYFVLVFVGSGAIPWYDWLLLVLNAFALTYSVVWGFRVEFKS